MLGDVEETIYIVSDDEDDDTVKVCTVFGFVRKIFRVRQTLMWNGRG